MSLFKEKDDYITEAFKSIFDQDSEEECADQTSKLSTPEAGAGSSSEDVPSPKKLKLDTTDPVTTSIETEHTVVSLGSDSNVVECINLDSDDDDHEINPPSKVSHQCKDPTQDDHIITIESDEESSIQGNTDTFESSFDQNSDFKPSNISFDLDDRDFNLKIILAGNLKQYRTTYRTKLCDCLQELLMELKSHGKTLVVTFHQAEVSLSGSPCSLKMGSGDILNAIEVPCQPSMDVNVNEITVKLQDGNKKHTKEFKIDKHKPLLELKKLYAKQFNLESIDNIKLLFDGDIADDESTADELEIEDGCVLDVKVTEDCFS